MYPKSNSNSFYKYETNSSSSTYSIATVNTTSLIEDAERKAISATNFIKDVVTLKKLGLTPLLVHGGGLGI